MKFNLHANQLLLICFALLCVLSLCTWIYWQGLNGPFALDDLPNIKPIAIETVSPENLLNAIAKNRSGLHSITRSLPTISLAITHALYGLDTFPYKFFNLALHLIIGCFVFLFVYLFHQAFSNNHRKSVTLALLTCSLWLLHPLHTSTTLYVIQRINQFSTLFTLIALCIYLYGRKSNNSLSKIILYFIAIPITIILGLMSKEVTVLICLYLLTLDFCTKNSTYWVRGSIDKLFINIFGWSALIIGAIGFITLFPKFTNYEFRTFTLAERLLSEIHVVFSYLRNLFIPKLSTMGLFLDDTTIQSHIDLTTLAKAFALLLLFVASLFGLKKQHFLGIFCIFFFGHLMESTVLPLELAFEHRNYLPSIALFACMAWIILKIPSKKIQYILIPSIIVFYSVLLFLRVGFWSNEQEWQKTNIAFHPHSLRANSSHLKYLNKNFGLDAVKQFLPTAKSNLPRSAEILIYELNYLCFKKDIDHFTESQLVIQKILAILTSQAITVQIENGIYDTAKNIEKLRCNNIDHSEVIRLINFAINKREQSNINTLNLYGARGLLFHAAGNHTDAAKDFIKGFYESKQANHIGLAFQSLIPNIETRKQAREILIKANKGDYFNPKHHQPLLKKLNVLNKQYAE